MPVAKDGVKTGPNPGIVLVPPEGQQPRGEVTPERMATPRDVAAGSELCKLLAAELESPEHQRGVEALSHLDRKEAIQTFIPLLTHEDNSISWGAARALGTLGVETPDEVFLWLTQLLDPQKDVGGLFAVVSALKELNDPRAIDLLVRLFRGMTHSKLRCSIASALGSFGEGTVPRLIEFLKKEDDARVRRALIRALEPAGAKAALPLLLEALEAPDRFLRLAAAEVLGKLDDSSVLPALCRALTVERDHEVAAMLTEAMRARGSWQELLAQFVETFRKMNVQRGTMDAAAIVSAITPPADEESDDDSPQLTYKLIEKALHQDPRMTSLMAALIIASCEGDSATAGKRLNEYAKAEKLSPEVLKQLRIELGGETALNPLIGPLEESLTKYFRIPVQNLNDNTQKQWRHTIWFAQVGFLLRMIMSTIVFAGGFLLLWRSSTKLLSGELSSDMLWGPGVSFVSGLGSMLLIIYTGPLREIQRSIVDLGSASAAFIAYVHRVMQISHTFSHYYLQQHITLEDLGKSCSLINDSMRDTVKTLQENRDGARTASKPGGSPSGQPARS